MGAGTAEVHHRVGLHVADVPADLAVPASAADFEEVEEVLVAARTIVVDGVGIIVHSVAGRTSIAGVVAVAIRNGRRLVVVAGRGVGTTLAGEVLTAAVVEVGRRVVVARPFDGTALIQTCRIPHEEKFLNGATRLTRTALHDDLAIADHLPGGLHREVVEVELQHVTIVRQTEVEVNGGAIGEFHRAHLHATQVAHSRAANVALRVHPAIGKGVIQTNGHTRVVAAAAIIEARIRVEVARRLIHTAGNAVELGQREVEGRRRAHGQFTAARPPTDER